MKKIVLRIDGMTCSACSNGLEKYLNKQDKIESATVNLVLAQAKIVYDDTLSISDIEQMVKDSGFESLGVYDTKKEEKRKRGMKGEKKIIYFRSSNGRASR